MSGPQISAILLAILGGALAAGARGVHARAFRWTGAILFLVGCALFGAATYDRTAALIERLF